MTVAQCGLNNNDTIVVVYPEAPKGGGLINIKFMRISEGCDNKICNCEILSLLKLCLLKEISSKLSEEKIKTLPQLVRCIMRILVKGYVKDGINIKDTIEEVSLKADGNNIINFSDYVDEKIDTNQIDTIINLLEKDDFQNINNIRFLLSKYNKYMKFFHSEFENAKKESIFEFSIISLVIIEREDYENFEKERESCPNRVKKILYHGIEVEPNKSSLKDLFRKTERFQHGKGIYFTNYLDYCWFYGGKDNKINGNKIPSLEDTFTLIACLIHYNKKGFKRVYDNKYSPKKNEINFAYIDAELNTIKEQNPNRRKFVGTDYIISDLSQICPFMSAKLKRNEFCVIWRDNNFSSKSVYKNEYDKIFKDFLKERLKYIKQVAKYNVYPCETSEEALNLVEKKKYNKIILISNVGNDLGGKTFVTNARKVIGSDVIILFLAYNISHLDWIKNFKNAIFSNEPKFYEEFLQCFDDSSSVKTKLNSLRDKVEKHYNVKFNFDDNFLNYPHFKNNGKYSDLSFNIPKKKIIKNNLNSSIITKEEYEMVKSSIEKIMKKDIKGIDKIFQATIDGDTPEIFHEKCDNISNTLVIYKSKGNRRFGGFASECWNSNGQNKEDKNCFLFSLDKKKIYLPKDNKYYKISCKANDGPSFINGGFYCIRLEKHSLKNQSLRTAENEELFGKDKFPLSEDSGFNGVYAKEYEVFEILL